MINCTFRKNLPINVPEGYRGKIYVFRHKTFKLVRISLSGTRSLPFKCRYSQSHEHPQPKGTQSHRNFYCRRKVSRNSKERDASWKWRIGSCIIDTDLSHIFGSNVGKYFRVLLREKGPHKPMFAYDLVSIHSLWIYTDLLEWNIVCDRKIRLLRCFPFISKSKNQGRL